MSDEEKPKTEVPANDRLLSDVAVNELRDAARRKGAEWSKYAPAEVARMLAREFILKDAFDRQEKPSEALRLAGLPGGGKAAESQVPTGNPRYPSLIELVELEELAELDAAQNQSPRAGGKPKTQLERVKGSEPPTGPESPGRR